MQTILKIVVHWKLNIFVRKIVNNTRIEGQLVIQEWIDGTRQEQPKTTPRVRLVAEDGSAIECEVGFIEPYVYGFSCEERYIDKTKKYELQVQSSTNKNISLNESIGFDKEGNEITFLEVLKTPKPEFELDIQKKDNIALLKKYFNVLTEREKEIIVKRYGLNDQDEITQKEIAKELGISRSYVSRIEKRALTKIFKEFKMQNKN